MFVQIIEARVKDRDSLAAEYRRWQKKLMPDAEGFLGSTAGVTADGRLIVAARFESPEAAQRNSDRPEQGEWWQQFSSHLEGEATFHDSTDIVTYKGGGNDSAGFVQVMQGRVKDVEAARRLSAEMEKELPERRPDVLGGMTVTYDDGAFTDVVYFTSLEEARRGEKEMDQDPPPSMQEWLDLVDGDITYYDLEDPWMISR